MIALAFAIAALASQASAALSVIADIEVSKLFATHTPWRFVALQGLPVTDPATPENGQIPGVIQFCFVKTAARTCERPMAAMPKPPDSDSGWAYEAHYLTTAQVVYAGARQTRPLLLVETAGAPSTDGNQIVCTQLIVHRPRSDHFSPIYLVTTGHNNNEETRFITSGPLKGDVISVSPTSDAPYGFWVMVDRLTPDDVYRQAIRYRSATHYDDGNRLAVIDSEMPNIERRLGLWRPGEPLPLPAGGCAKPRLIHGELWCGGKPG